MNIRFDKSGNSEYTFIQIKQCSGIYLFQLTDEQYSATLEPFEFHQQAIGNVLALHFQMNHRREIERILSANNVAEARVLFSKTFINNVARMNALKKLKEAGKFFRSHKIHSLIAE